ncbi:MAG: DNA damage-inducible protein D [Candidatus Shapirobacteria bacterium]|jgi:DNA-damage-inducible protein D
MSTSILPTSPTQNFEKIKIIDSNNIEYWSARELMSVLDYSRWENFVEVIKKAQKACLNSGQNVENHFRNVTKMTVVGGNTPVALQDWNLDRYACYLIAQNGDSRKPVIALAQTYFAIQSRRQELFDQLGHEEKRVFIRDEVTDQNKKLFSTAKKAGVSNFGFFNDAGYRGLYNHPLSEIEKIKGVKKGELLDHAGSTELAANLFRITQTEEIINRDKNIYGNVRASNTHLNVGRKVRKTIEEIGGILPENLPTEKHIRLIKKDLKKIK